jgi:tetratricopeptide (TPR) repeat protein
MIIWIASYPKSGNTWLRALISAYYYTDDGIYKESALKKIDQFPTKKYFENFKYDKQKAGDTIRYWIDAQKIINQDKELKFFKTHNAFGIINGYNFTNTENSIGCVYIVRDPRNVFTSLKNHYEMDDEKALSWMQNEKNFLYDVEQFSDFGYSDFQFISSWQLNYKSWKLQKKIPLKFIKYEDLVNQTYSSASEIINFINKITKSPDKIIKDKLKNAVQSTSFDKLKKKEDKEGFSEAVTSRKQNNKKITFFNLGPKNKWNELLNDNQKNKLNLVFKKSLIELSYEIYNNPETALKITSPVKPSKVEIDNLQKFFQDKSYVAAEKLAMSMIKEFPKYQFGWKILGSILNQTNRLEKALKINLKAIELLPEDFQAHYNIGNTYKKLDEFNKAEKSYLKSIELKSDYFFTYHNLGNLYSDAGRPNEAKKNYEQAIKINPNYFQTYNNLGNTLADLGDLDEAKESYQKAILLRPNLTEAHRNLTLIKKFDSKDEQYFKMKELFFDQNISENDKCNINFGLAKVYDDLKKYEKAFNHYQQGNALRKKILKYDITSDIKLFNLVKSNYKISGKTVLDLKNLTNQQVPIFIIGMLRSGTTLVEQIISSHSQVAPAGELPFVARFGLSISIGKLPMNLKNLINFRKDYLYKIKERLIKKPFFTDKMPLNFLHVGLILAAFPEAKIIHVKRDAAAVCWANYKQFFSAEDIGYCYDLNDIIKYYKSYNNLISFWNKQLPNKIFHLDYEKLVIDQENTIRNLIHYLNLDWEDECLFPQENTRSVKTASNTQIRRPIYKGSSEQWKNYKPFLGGIFDNLD